MGTYLQVEIETQAPVILTANRSNLLTATEKEFSGGTLRGIFVKKWLEQEGCTADSPAFEDFFFGALRFLPARPEACGSRTYFLPRSLQQSKDKKEFADLLAGAAIDHKKGFKGKKGLGTVVEEDGSPCIAEPVVHHHIRMHIARGGRDDADGKNRLAGRSLGGGIFNYEAIDAGQSFLGEIHGPETTLDAFEKSLPRSFACRIGRSHQTQYGKCRVTVTRKDEARPVVSDAESICLRLETPLVTDGMALDANHVLHAFFLQPLAEKLPGRTFAVSDIYGAQQTLSGFHSAWGMKRPDALALAEGTVFCLKKEDGTAFSDEELDAIDALAHEGVGIRVEEGFGQLRFWQPGSFHKKKDDDDLEDWTPQQAEDVLAGRTFASETQRIAARILARRLQEQARLQAWNDADTLRDKEHASLSSMTHFFARLENLLGTRQRPADVPAAFRRDVSEACSSGDEEKKLRPFAKRLHSLAFNCKGGRTLTLEQAILGTEDEPFYTLTDFLPAAKENEKDMLADFADRVLPPGWEHDSVLIGSTYYDYWLSFARHARKLAVAAGKAEEGDGQDG